MYYVFNGLFALFSRGSIVVFGSKIVAKEPLLTL